MLALMDSSSKDSKRISSCSPMVFFRVSLSCLRSGICCHRAMVIQLLGGDKAGQAGRQVESVVPEYRLATLGPLGETLTIGTLNHGAFDLQGLREKGGVPRPHLLDQDQTPPTAMPAQALVALGEQGLQAVSQLATGLTAGHLGEHAERH